MVGLASIKATLAAAVYPLLSAPRRRVPAACHALLSLRPPEQPRYRWIGALKLPGLSIGAKHTEQLGRVGAQHHPGVPCDNRQDASVGTVRSKHAAKERGGGEAIADGSAFAALLTEYCLLSDAGQPFRQEGELARAVRGASLPPLLRVLPRIKVVVKGLAGWDVSVAVSKPIFGVFAIAPVTHEL